MNKVDLFMEYDAFGMWERAVPKHLAAFSNTDVFLTMDDLVGRIALERNTKVSKSFANETTAIMKKHFDSQESIDTFRNFVMEHENEFQ